MRTCSRIATAAVVSALTTTAACGSGDDSSSDASVDGGASAAPSGSPVSAGPDSDPAGPGCSAYAKQVPDGKGSIAGMAADPVAVAIAHNPILRTLSAAVSGQLNPKVNLLDTLDGAKLTVFAPIDSAFAQLPTATVKTLGTPQGARTLTKLLKYHVVAGRLRPDQIAGRTLRTVEGGRLTISGSGDSLRSQRAHVICGGITTANANLYLIDSVMMPPSTGGSP